MRKIEAIFGNLMLGLIAGMILWASLGSFYSMFFGDDLSLLGHHGGRGSSDAYVDTPY